MLAQTTMALSWFEELLLSVHAEGLLGGKGYWLRLEAGLNCDKVVCLHADEG